jgi:hypothetical protein
MVKDDRAGSLLAAPWPISALVFKARSNSATPMHSRNTSIMEKITLQRQKGSRGSSRRSALICLSVLLLLAWKLVPRHSAGTGSNHQLSERPLPSPIAKGLNIAFYTIPKPFAKARSQQERAIASWTLLPFNVDINLVLSSDSDVQEFQEVAAKYDANLLNVRLDPEGNVLVRNLLNYCPGLIAFRSKMSYSPKLQGIPMPMWWSF